MRGREDMRRKRGGGGNLKRDQKGVERLTEGEETESKLGGEKWENH